MRQFLLNIFLFASLANFAQSDKMVDSLKQIINLQSADSSNLENLIKLVRRYGRFNPDSASRYHEILEKLAEKNGQKRFMAEAISVKGQHLTSLGKYQQALECFHKGYELFEQIGKKRPMANLQNSMGNVLMGIGEKQKALVAYRLSNKLAAEAGATDLVAISGLGIGNSIIGEGKFQEAINQFRISLTYFQSVKDPYTSAIANLCIAGAFLDMGNPDSAFAFIRQGLKLGESINEQYAVFNAHQYLGRYYQMKRDYLRAADNFKLALQEAKQMSAIEDQKQITFNMSELAKEQNDYKTAYEYYVQFKMFSDSLLDKEKTKQLIEANEKYESHKKEKEIAIQQEEIKRERLMKYSAFGLSGLVLVMLVLVFINLRNKKKAFKVIASQKLIIEEKNRNITDSINYARNIQESILPSDDFVYQYLRQSFILFIPRDIVSGDFYFVKPADNGVWFAVVDCTGHGVPGAFMSMAGYSALRQVIDENPNAKPGEILSGLNKWLGQHFGQARYGTTISDGMDMSLCFLTNDYSELLFAGANHHLYLVRNRELSVVNGNKRAISGSENNVVGFNFNSHKINLQKGDTIYLTTDGFADQFGGEHGKKFKVKQFKELLLSENKFAMHEQKQHFYETFKNWKGKMEQIDDILLLGIRI